MHQVNDPHVEMADEKMTWSASNNQVQDNTGSEQSQLG